jgi:hypothetical protein
MNDFRPSDPRELQAYDIAFRYISRVAALVAGQYISVHHRSVWTTQSGKQHVSFPGEACSDVHTAAEQAVYWSHRAKTDVYLAMGSQINHGGLWDNNGMPRRLPQALRKRSNVGCCRCLYMDVDVDTDPEKDAYGTVEELNEGIEQFYTKTSFPKAALVVNSGRGGKHLYWPFERLIRPNEFRPLARALSAAAKSSGLKFDRECTVDICRLLRIPGTFNFKDHAQDRIRPPLPVTFDRLSRPKGEDSRGDGHDGDEDKDEDGEVETHAHAVHLRSS